MRFVVRPNTISRTPRLLRTALGARRTIPVSRVVQADYRQDLFLAYPSPALVANAPEDYAWVHRFYSSDKYTQRLTLHSAGQLPIVPTVGCPEFGSAERYVVRPLRHRAGIGYRITNSSTDYDSSCEYISNLIQKDKEYRALYYKGHHVCTYLKSNPDNIPADQPWTHANGCKFVTIQQPCNDKIVSSGLGEKLLETTLVKTASLVAFDVLLSNRDLYVCEANLSPGLTIQGTIDKITHIQNSISA